MEDFGIRVIVKERMGILYNVVNGMDDAVCGDDVGLLDPGAGGLGHNLHHAALEYLKK